AYNVTWKSTNFKTVLTWEPKPSADYSYTVEFFRAGQDRRRSPLCVRSSATQCDLSGALSSLTSSYTADVLSEPPLGEPSEGSEAPHQSSPRFCPYNDILGSPLNAPKREPASCFLSACPAAEIGKPDFKLEVSEDQRKTTLFVSDPLTALFKDGRQLTLRDVFADKLMYKVTYRKNRSTGKKEHVSQSSVIELAALDRGRSYCFSVQAFIPSRAYSKQLGEQSHVQCSQEEA
ncbi:unnamed protein product, partial [Tetraodon nigroviridis]